MCWILDRCWGTELQKELEATHRELKERARDCKKLEREQKALAIHRLGDMPY